MSSSSMIRRLFRSAIRASVAVLPEFVGRLLGRLNRRVKSFNLLDVVLQLFSLKLELAAEKACPINSTEEAAYVVAKHDY